MQELQANYDGTSEGARRKQFSRADPKKIFYKNETNFTFEKHVTKIKGISMCWEIMVHQYMRIRWPSIY